MSCPAIATNIPKLLYLGFALYNPSNLKKNTQSTQPPTPETSSETLKARSDQAQFANCLLLCEHSTRQVNFRGNSKQTGRREEDTQRILEVRVSGRERARLDSAGPFTLSLRERTLFWRFLANRALLIFHNAASLRLATLVLTAVIAARRKERE